MFSMTDVNLTNNTLLISSNRAIFAINETQNVNLSHFSMFDTKMKSSSLSPHFLFQIISPYGVGNSITMDDLLISGDNILQLTKALDIQGEFRNVNISNVSISDLSIVSGAILSADMAHRDEKTLFIWFGKRTASLLTLENFMLQNLSLSASNIFDFSKH